MIRSLVCWLIGHQLHGQPRIPMEINERGQWYLSRCRLCRQPTEGFLSKGSPYE